MQSIFSFYFDFHHYQSNERRLGLFIVMQIYNVYLPTGTKISFQSSVQASPPLKEILPPPRCRRHTHIMFCLTLFAQELSNVT